MTDLTKLIELQAAATGGTWMAYKTDRQGVNVHSDGLEIAKLNNISGNSRYHNGLFIAAARNFDFAALDEKIKRYEDALNYIAIGCLVPPDGGSPCLNDAMEAARKALEGIE